MVIKGLGSPVGILTFGTLLSQIIIFSSTVVMGQLYLPEDFGFYSLIINISGIIALILSKSYETFIVPSGSDEDAGKVFLAGVRLVFSTWIFMVAFSFLGFSVYKVIDFPSIKFSLVLWLSLLLAPLLALYSLSYQLVLRNMKYRILATRGPIQNSAIGFSQGVLSYFDFQSIGLVLGEILGRLIGLSFLLSNIRSLSFEIPKRNFWKQKFDKIDKPVMINFFSIGFDMLAAAALLIYVNLHFGDWAAGQLSMAQRIVVLPVVFLGVNFAQYFLSSASHNRRNGVNLSRTSFDAAVIRLFFTSIGIAALLFFSGSWILSVFLGEEWATAGRLIRVLVPFMVVSFVWNPMSSYYYVNGLWREFLKISLGRLICICLSALVAKFAHLNLYETTILMTVASGIVQVYGVLMLRKSFSTDSN
jgi:O-antigen/teichoic acid export membrane protein